MSIGNPQCAIEAGEELEGLDLRDLGPAIETNELFPNRTNVSFWRRDGDDAITARIFERGAGETSSRSNQPCSMSRARLTPVAAPVKPAPCKRLIGIRKLW